MNQAVRERNSLRIEFDDVNAFRVLAGRGEANLKAVEQRARAAISSRGTTVHVQGDPHAVKLSAAVLNQLYGLAKRGHPLYAEDVVRAVDVLSSDRGAQLSEVLLDEVHIPKSQVHIAPKGPTQKAYMEAIRRNDLVFGIGPAGTGKTYLAMAMAVRALMSKEVKRIVLARPAVEAGEKLGYLPGDLAQKVDPYLRPLYDALHDMMSMERAQKLLAQGTIEIAPLAFMRGRTLNDAFVILDEAQNTTSEQMKMFLTRLGFHSRTVVTGDITQIDLPFQRPSGLVHCVRILRGIDGIGFIEFTKADVVRHPLVQRIIQAYEEDGADEPQDDEQEERRRDLVMRATTALESRREEAKGAAGAKGI